MQPKFKPHVRRAVSLMELTVVLAVLAMFVGLLLASVQSARHAAARAEALNVARQLLLATHAFAEANKGLMPNADGQTPNAGQSVSEALAAYVGGKPDVVPDLMFLKSDPSLDWSTDLSFAPIAPDGKPFIQKGSSFAFNQRLYTNGMLLNIGASDGPSCTIALTEHYGSCGRTTFWPQCQRSWCQLNSSEPRVTCITPSARRATFADFPDFDDVHPVTEVHNGVAVTVGNQPLTFQVRPTKAECNPRVPQSSLPGGILAGMLDGSVKFVRPGVSPEVFWGSVTPAGGEAVTLD